MTTSENMKAGLRSSSPQRYSSDLLRYRSLGGLINPDSDADKFLLSGIPDYARYYMFCLIFDQICKERIAGDIAELGVYRGHTAALLSLMARRLGKTALLFDTFEGFDSRDIQGIDSGKTLDFSDTSLAAVRDFVGIENVQFIKGYFPDSTDQVSDLTRYALVHIDCDLYLPMMSALSYFYPKMEPGGFLVIHDYSSLVWDGAERAVDEFFADKPESVTVMPDSAGSAVIRRARLEQHNSNWRVLRNKSFVDSGWVQAGLNNLVWALLGGWSVPEDWGVWGVGAEHGLVFHLPTAEFQHVAIAIDLHAPISSDHPEQILHIYGNGQHVGRFVFNEGLNNGVREIVLAKEQVPSDVIELSLRPESNIIPAIRDPRSKDRRELGVALRAVKIELIGATPTSR